jgi:AcrR family transcriptional regulator
LFITQSIKRGRPKQNHGATELKEKRIIEASKKLFHEEGFDSVSMRRIAADVGMEAITLYKYFANKNAILHPIWDELIVELFTGLQEKVSAENTHNFLSLK